MRCVRVCMCEITQSHTHKHRHKHIRKHPSREMSGEHKFNMFLKSCQALKILFKAWQTFALLRVFAQRSSVFDLEASLI